LRAALSPLFAWWTILRGPDSRFLDAQTVEQGARAVGRAVVDDDDLKGMKRLAGDRFQRLLKVSDGIESWDDDADQRSWLNHSHHILTVARLLSVGTCGTLIALTPADDAPRPVRRTPARLGRSETSEAASRATACWCPVIYELPLHKPLPLQPPHRPEHRHRFARLIQQPSSPHPRPTATSSPDPAT